MRLVLQPTGSNVCGQACVAMLAGCTIEEACALVGKKGKTRSRDLITALRSSGFFTGDRCVRFRGFDCLPSTAILHLVHPDWRHWALWNEGQVWDPGGKPTGFFTGCRQKLLRITSFLPVWR